MGIPSTFTLNSADKNPWCSSMGQYPACAFVGHLNPTTTVSNMQPLETISRVMPTTSIGSLFMVLRRIRQTETARAIAHRRSAMIPPWCSLRSMSTDAMLFMVGKSPLSTTFRLRCTQTTKTTLSTTTFFSDPLGWLQSIVTAL